MKHKNNFNVSIGTAVRNTNRLPSLASQSPTNNYKVKRPDNLKNLKPAIQFSENIETDEEFRLTREMCQMAAELDIIPSPLRNQASSSDDIYEDLPLNHCRKVVVTRHNSRHDGRSTVFTQHEC